MLFKNKGKGFKILVFQVVSGVKGQEMTQNDSCLSDSISQEPYMI